MTFCPFCHIKPDDVLHSTDLCLAVRDGFPVSAGHTLIVPRRHVSSFFELSTGEQADMMRLVSECRRDLEVEYSPAGYNIGVNDGAAAGQTVMHVHLHLIPRYEGDVDDPRGGVRWVLAEKARYWEDS